MNGSSEADRLRQDASADLSPEHRQMLADVVAGLSSEPRTLPSKYFYDDTGSRLFDEITELEEYYLTRTETAIMEEHVSEMVEAMGADVLLVEFGSGSSIKTRILLDHMKALAGYVPIDISGEYLSDVAAALRARHPEVPILPLAADFTKALTLPSPPRAPERRVVFFPGSTIGNFPVLEAARLLRRVRTLAGPDGAVLLGFDLVKPREHLAAAYNDAAGVTARFNLNLLERLNRDLGANFDVSAFRHDAPFNEDASRIEMHLVSRTHQSVHLGGRTFAFEPGESIVTEFSHKYTLESFGELARSAGLQAARSWTDERDFFCVQLLETAEG